MKKPLLITEISGNHNGNKKLFLEHIREAALNGADIIKIQTYEPQDITLKVFDERFRIKKVPGKISIFGIYIKKHTHHSAGTRKLLIWQRN